MSKKGAPGSWVPIPVNAAVPYEPCSSCLAHASANTLARASCKSLRPSVCQARASRAGFLSLWGRPSPSWCGRARRLHIRRSGLSRGICADPEAARGFPPCWWATCVMTSLCVMSMGVPTWHARLFHSICVHPHTARPAPLLKHCGAVSLPRQLPCCHQPCSARADDSLQAKLPLPDSLHAMHSCHLRLAGGPTCPAWRMHGAQNP